MTISTRVRVAIVVAALMALVAAWYCYLIITAQIEPVLASWTVFFTGAILGFWTYLRADKKELTLEEKRDKAVTNVANACDVFVIGVILSCIALFGEKARFGFTLDQWVSLGVTGIIFIIVLTSPLWVSEKMRKKEAFAANIAVNVVLAIGYVPTVIKLWSADHNTESFSLWSLMWITVFISAYNPLKERDPLAIVYAVRGLVLAGIVLGLMARIELTH